MSRTPDRQLNARDALLYWAHESVPIHQWADLSKVFESPRTRSCGAQLAWNEIMEAVECLQNAGLVEALEYTVRGRTTVHLIRPSIDGRSIVQAKGSVTKYVDAKRQPGYTGLPKVDVNVHHASAVALAIGDNNTQTVTTGIDSSALVHLVTELRSLALHLGLPAEDTEDLLTDIDSLREGADDPKNTARVWRNIKRFLSTGLKPENIALAARVGAEVTPERIQAVIEAGESLF
ncbi:hypothetical protein [Kitasatospora purpeofusca]|uniref:hypothetical protein n=1 Tax=Kitasatospora purpeofusca TaxID=67352 RepID=UPI0036B8619C